MFGVCCTVKAHGVVVFLIVLVIMLSNVYFHGYFAIVLYLLQKPLCLPRHLRAFHCSPAAHPLGSLHSSGQPQPRLCHWMSGQSPHVKKHCAAAGAQQCRQPSKRTRRDVKVSDLNGGQAT